MAEVIADTPEYTEYRDVTPAGERVWCDPKPGSAIYNANLIRQQAITAIATLESNYTNWASLTNAQKDTANRLAQRVCAKTVRYLLDQLESAGP